MLTHLPLLPTLGLTTAFALMAAAVVKDELDRRRGVRRRADALRSYVTRQTVIADPAAEAGSSATPGSNVALHPEAGTSSEISDSVRQAPAVLDSIDNPKPLPSWA